jgi:hypothetical protein
MSNWRFVVVIAHECRVAFLSPPPPPIVFATGRIKRTTYRVAGLQYLTVFKSRLNFHWQKLLTHSVPDDNEGEGAHQPEHQEAQRGADPVYLQSVQNSKFFNVIKYQKLCMNFCENATLFAKV